MIARSPCPSRRDLERLVLGEMPALEMEMLEAHVSACSSCLIVIRGVKSEDALVDAVRDGAKPRDGLPEAVDEALIARLCRLHPHPAAPDACALDTSRLSPGKRPTMAEEASRLLAPPQEPDEMGRIGGYGLLRTLGHGGMGIVFAARQARPRRVVALKMMLAGPRAGRQRLERFRDESEILARLQHPNIIGIHEVGEHDGWPYFTMTYAEGGSLAQKLAGASLPAGEAAGLIAVLARAVSSAHEQNIVHRDLKPANVLLSAEGSPLVGDFGLAKQLGDETAATAAGYRTETGAILGTPSYTAPEQIAGRSEQVGPAADVYALGAILYECLTGRPPFKAASLLETLEQVRTQEPVPPGRLQPGLPRDLQTICLKCLEKDPGRRYASACALADDLDRFLAGKSIAARPAPFWERIGKWARRRPAAAALVGVSSLSALRFVAAVLLHNARLQRAINRAEAKEEEARQQHELADARYRAARDSMGRMLDRLNAARLADVPRLKELREELLEDSLAFYQKVLEQADDPDPAVRLDAAGAYAQTAGIQFVMGRQGPSDENYRRALTLVQELPAEYRDRPQTQELMARCHAYLGKRAADVGRFDEAERNCLKAFTIIEGLGREDPDNATWQNELARAEHHLGVVYQTKGRLRDAETHYLRGISIRTALVRRHPGDKGYQATLAETHLNLGLVYAATDRASKAGAAYEKAASLLQPLVRGRPENDDYALALAGVCNNWGNLLNSAGKRTEALKVLTQGVELAEAVLLREPRDLTARLRALVNHGARAQVHDSQEQWAEAVKDWDRVVALEAGPDRWMYLLFRALDLARAGQHARAAAEAQALKKEPNLSPEGVYRLANLYSLAIRAVRMDGRLTSTEQVAAAERYALEAIALLRQLQAQGYFKDAANAQALETEPDLLLLRGRADFQRVWGQVKAGMK